MAEHASQEITIETKAARVLEVVLELDEYPQWIPEIISVTVFSRDSRGRAILAELTSHALGKTITHTYEYSYENYPDEIRWILESGDMANSLEGIYRVKGGCGLSTTVSYELTVDMSVAIPGFMKSKAAEKIVSSALENLKARCEKVSNYPSNALADDEVSIYEGKQNRGSIIIRMITFDKGSPLFSK